MSMDNQIMKQIQRQLISNNFAIVPWFDRIKNVNEYKILLSKGFDAKDLLHAYFVAYKKARHLLVERCDNDAFDDCYRKEFINFQQKVVEAGWNIGHLQLSTHGFTGKFLQPEKDI